jgi:hypothetical protein
MKGSAGVLILLAALGLAGSWLLGYREGEQTGAFGMLHQIRAEVEKAGIDKGRDQVCDEIRNYKFSMAKDLDQNTQICGWPDMGGPKNSN